MYHFILQYASSGILRYFEVNLKKDCNKTDFCKVSDSWPNNLLIKQTVPME